MSNSTSNLRSCSYCGLQSNTSLVQCQADSCGRWFCNHKAGSNGSHIYLHLHSANHRKISIPSSEISMKSSLSCGECQETNIYALSVVNHGKAKLILCHDTCLKAKSKKEYQRLGPVIQENKISSHLLKNGSSGQPKLVSSAKIRVLEKLWRRELDPNSDCSDVSDCSETKRKFYLQKAPDQFDSVKAYQNVFASLLRAEAEHEKDVLEAMIHHNVEVIWKKIEHVVYAELKLSNANHFGGTLKEGDFLILESKETGEFRGNVAAAKKDKKILVRLAKREMPENTTAKYTVKPVWNAVSHYRMTDGLKMISQGRLSKTLASHLLGNPPQINPEVKKEPKYNLSNCAELARMNLNESQLEAALKALNAESLFLIQGPPGTGKTHTLGALISQVNKNLGRYQKILVCGSSNKAVNTITEKLIENGVEGICRIYAVSKEKSQLPAALEKVALHNLIRGKDAKLKDLLQRQKNNENLSLKDKKELMTLKGRTQEEIIRNSRIICCTCATAGDGRLEGFLFKNVFIDEAAQATEPECVLPWLYGAEKVILSGDHKQISPIIQSSEAKQAGLDRSLFERLIANPDNYYMLKYQYRMNPAISEFPSRHFYQNQLIPDSSLAQRKFQLRGPFTDNIPNFFYHISGKEEIPAAGISQLNREEALAVKKIVYNLLDSGVKPSQIGVITFYNGQKALITELIEKRRELCKKIDISSVDGFQGGEKDYIIISCVRSNDELGIGFLRDEKRLNVALTRAKYGMIVAGNADVLCRDPNWKALVESYNQKGHIFQGELKSLKTYHVACSKTA